MEEGLKLEDLQWKTSTVEGFDDDMLGLEEIEGVGVKVLNGKTTFYKADNKPKNKKRKVADKEVQASKKQKVVEAADSIIDLNDIVVDKANETTNEEKLKAQKKSERKKSQKEKNSKDEAVTEIVGVENPFAILDQDTNEIEAFDSTKDSWDPRLSDEIRRALVALGFTSPTEIQRLAIPQILDGKNVIGKAMTGSGKTLAFGIPILEKFLAEPKSLKTFGLILSPTRELALQITKHLKLISKNIEFNGVGILPITGGLAAVKQVRLLKKKPAILVATPGRLLELIKEDDDVKKRLQECPTVVLDEADRLVQEGHFEEMEEILQLIGRKHQTCVFSATFSKEFTGKLQKGGKYVSSSSENNIVNMLSKKLKFSSKPILLDANPEQVVASKVVESVIECGATEKDLYTYYFCLMYPGRTIVFVNAIETVKRLAPLLKELGLPAVGLHSDMIQKQRLRSLERFSQSSNGVLVTTDVAARGLDIPQVNHVVHYHLSRSADMYIHRSGRTARAGKDGVSVVICSPEERASLNKLKKLTHKDIKPFVVDYDVVSNCKERVQLAKKISDMTVASARKGKTDSWLDEAAKDLGIDDDELESVKDDKKSPAVTSQAEMKAARSVLKELLSKPLGKTGKYLTNGTVNIANMLSKGQSHNQVLGKSVETALDRLQKRKKT